MGWKSSDVFRFDLGPHLQGQTRTAKVKSGYNSLIIGLRGLLCETNFQDIMAWVSSDVITFDLWPPPSRSSDGSLALVSCLSG